MCRIPPSSNSNSESPSSLNTTDVFLVNRGSCSYKINAQDLADELQDLINDSDSCFCIKDDGSTLGCGLEIAANKLQVDLLPGGGIICTEDDPCDDTAGSGISVDWDEFPGLPDDNVGCGIAQDDDGVISVELKPDGGISCGAEPDEPATSRT